MEEDGHGIRHAFTVFYDFTVQAADGVLFAEGVAQSSWASRWGVRLGGGGKIGIIYETKK